MHLRDSEIVALYVVFRSQDEAESIGRAMVEQKLAACVNVLGSCRSIYRWQGAVQEADEVAAIFKTQSARAEALMAAIHTAHAYDVPAIVQLPIAAAHRDYSDWVIAETR
ncbi:divalent-cation tolerance protein CutA [Sphingosinicella sp.]|uniref:divalent-cation tolerance protein CutA n=1 Tax=Sphingosinicella sp. TaxID=1917971 RepID=UPI004037FB99